jgi:AraC family transcriptional regulator
MTKERLERYQERLRRALAHIDRNLDADLRLETVSGVAAFSKHHFHRQFGATLGLSLRRYVELARMKRASFRLAFRENASVTEIAMDAGYEAPDAFARAFRRRFGQSPSDFRKSPEWEPWRAAFEPLGAARILLMKTSFAIEDVTIVETPAIPVAVMAHQGDPARIGDTIRRFVAWRKSVGLSPRTSATYNIFPSDPRATAPEDFRLDLCAAADHIAPNEEGVEPGLIPAGRCAKLRVIGSSDDLEPAALFLYRDWLPASGEETRDFPLYCRRVTFFPDAPEHEAVTDLFLPLR